MVYRKVPEMSEETRAVLLEETEVLVARKLRTDAALAAQLRDALKQGWVVKDLAKALGLSSATVSRWSRDAPQA